ncbi:MAG: sulfurtransferase TusA family protein [Synergistaceae bacterium]|jgi:TusA-related sulfurtransferase|nr:sulfurtransferase TusA family protein [Synergistaceae bacterium]
MSENFVDTRGYSCPEPLLMTRDAARRFGNQPFTVAVSSPTARDNVSDFLEDSGRKVTVETEGSGWLIKAASAPRA